MKSRKIKTNFDKRASDRNIRMGGWYSGKDTYLWVGPKSGSGPIGILSGRKLKRFCETVLKEMKKDGI